MTAKVQSAAPLRLQKAIGKEVKVFSYRRAAILLALSNDGKKAFVKTLSDGKKIEIDPSEIYVPRN